MRYLSAQIKRIARYLPFAVFTSLVLAVVLSLFAARFIGADASMEDKQIIRIGMVGDTSSTFLGFGIELIREADSSKMMLSLDEMSESEAAALLNEGKISAYIRVPDGFVDGVAHGNVMELDYVTSDVSGGITSVFKEEILSAVSNMLVHSQKGIFAMQTLDKSLGKTVNYRKNNDEIILRYFNLIIKRPSVLSLDVRGVSNGVDFATYLTCGLCVLCISLFGIPYCGLFSNTDRSLRRLSASRGISVTRQVFCEFCVYLFAIILTLFVVIFAAAMVGIAQIGFVLPLFFKCLPALVLVASLQFFAFTLSDNTVSSVLIQFFGAISLSYLCGCIYPISFFPNFLETVGNAFPLGVARSFLITALISDIDFLCIFVSLAYSLALVLCAAFVEIGRTKLEG
jgi:hypothetical protein